MYLIVLVVLSLAAFLYWKMVQRQKIDKQNWNVHNQLVKLTESVKISSGNSSVDFSVWAELNDLILEAVTEYYNGSGDSQKLKHESSNKYISTARERLREIEASSFHKESLECYIQELKLTKL